MERKATTHSHTTVNCAALLSSVYRTHSLESLKNPFGVSLPVRATALWVSSTSCTNAWSWVCCIGVWLYCSSNSIKKWNSQIALTPDACPHWLYFQLRANSLCWTSSSSCVIWVHDTGPWPQVKGSVSPKSGARFPPTLPQELRASPPHTEPVPIYLALFLLLYCQPTLVI